MSGQVVLTGDLSQYCGERECVLQPDKLLRLRSRHFLIDLHSRCGG